MLQVFSPAGSPLGAYDGRTSPAGAFGEPRDVALQGGSVLVADSVNQRIVRVARRRL